MQRKLLEKLDNLPSQEKKLLASTDGLAYQLRTIHQLPSIQEEKQATKQVAPIINQASFTNSSSCSTVATNQIIEISNHIIGQEEGKFQFGNLKGFKRAESTNQHYQKDLGINKLSGRFKGTGLMSIMGNGKLIKSNPLDLLNNIQQSQQNLNQHFSGFQPAYQSSPNKINVFNSKKSIDLTKRSSFRSPSTEQTQTDETENLICSQLINSKDGISSKREFQSQNIPNSLNTKSLPHLIQPLNVQNPLARCPSQTQGSWQNSYYSGNRQGMKDGMQNIGSSSIPSSQQSSFLPKDLQEDNSTTLKSNQNMKVTKSSFQQMTASLQNTYQTLQNGMSETTPSAFDNFSSKKVPKIPILRPLNQIDKMNKCKIIGSDQPTSFQNNQQHDCNPQINQDPSPVRMGLRFCPPQQKANQSNNIIQNTLQNCNDSKETIISQSNKNFLNSHSSERTFYKSTVIESKYQWSQQQFLGQSTLAPSQNKKQSISKDILNITSSHDEVAVNRGDISNDGDIEEQEFRACILEGEKIEDNSKNNNTNQKGKIKSWVTAPVAFKNQINVQHLKNEDGINQKMRNGQIGNIQRINRQSNGSSWHSSNNNQNNKSSGCEKLFQQQEQDEENDFHQLCQAISHI